MKLRTLGRALRSLDGEAAEAVDRAADKIDQLTAEASLYEDSLASYAQENAALRARVAELEVIEREAERIKTEAHLAADHSTYDLMRTVLSKRQE